MKPYAHRATRRTFLAAAGAVVAVMAPALAQTGAEPAIIRVGSGIDDSVTPLLYAQHAGLFARAGLTVDVQKFNSGSVVAAAVAGGSLEIGRSSTLPVVTAFARGLPFTLVAPGSLYRAEAPYGGLLVPAGSSIRSAHDLAGKTVAVAALSDMFALSLHAWLDQSGVDFQAVHLLELTPPAVPAALDAGRIDAAVVFEPLYSATLGTKKYRVVTHTFDAVSKHFQDVAYFSNVAWVATHRDEIARFARVMHDANAYVSAHEDETIPLIAAFTGLDPATIAHMVRPGRAPYIDAAEIQPVIDVAARYGVIAKSFAAQEFIGPSGLRPGR